jgi:hypothetical protein
MVTHSHGNHGYHGHEARLDSEFCSSAAHLSLNRPGKTGPTFSGHQMRKQGVTVGPTPWHDSSSEIIGSQPPTDFVNPRGAQDTERVTALVSETSYLRRPIPLAIIVLLALSIHGPLLLMELPATTSYDANLHIFFGSHYAQHWFNPWNEKWFAGFSQTTYPPLTHQWIALLSHIVGLTEAFMLVQLAAIVLLVVGTWRFARLWVDDRAASWAALLSIFAGSVAFLTYSAGQLPTLMSAPLYLLALPYFYEWSRSGAWRALLKGLVLTLAAASAHHVTLIFGSVLFAAPVLWLAYSDARQEGRSTSAVFGRAFVFAVVAVIGVGAVLLPYWIAILRHPIEQMPIPHGSRLNFLFSWVHGVNYFVIPYGALILALPFIVLRGSAVPRLRVLLLAFWIAFLLALGGTTPLPRWVFGRAFEILTFERFTLWATMLALPILGLVATELIDRYRYPGAFVIATGAVATLALALGWLTWSPFRTTGGLKVDSVVNFLNRDGHDQYRYITLGFGNSLSKVGTYANANSVDGEYNSARLLPEMTRFGSAQLTSAKFFGSAGMDSLRAMLQHANQYGLKFIFVHDPYYNPLLVFAGWRQIETYDSGAITVWSKDDVPPAHKIVSDSVPAPWEGLMWGLLPIGSSILAILFAFLLGDRTAKRGELLAIPSPSREHVYAGEAHP